MKTCNILLLSLLLISYLPGCSGEEKKPPVNLTMQEVPSKLTLHQVEYKAYITDLMEEGANHFIIIDTLEWINDSSSGSGFSIRNKRIHCVFCSLIKQKL